MNSIHLNGNEHNMDTHFSDVLEGCAWAECMQVHCCEFEPDLFSKVIVPTTSKIIDTTLLDNLSTIKY